MTGARASAIVTKFGIRNCMGLAFVGSLHLKPTASKWYRIINSFPRVLHIWVGELGQHWFRSWIVTCLTPSHNQWSLVVSWTHWNKLWWNLNQNSKLFIHKNAQKNVIYKLEVISSRQRWVNSWMPANTAVISDWFRCVNSLANNNAQDLIYHKIS